MTCIVDVVRLLTNFRIRMQFRNQMAKHLNLKIADLTFTRLLINVTVAILKYLDTLAILLTVFQILIFIKSVIMCVLYRCQIVIWMMRKNYHHHHSHLSTPAMVMYVTHGKVHGRATNTRTRSSALSLAILTHIHHIMQLITILTVNRTVRHMP